MRSESEVKAVFRTKYGYLTSTEVNAVYDTALNTYLEMAFPFEPTLTTIPADRPRAWTWVYDCMNEIMERSGCSSMTEYSENGLSIKWDRAGISKGLLSRITPKVGVVV